MENFYENRSAGFDTDEAGELESAFDKFIHFQQNKSRRHKEHEYKKLKTNVEFITAIIVILAMLLTTSILVASGLYIKNTLLTSELSQQSDDFAKAVTYYETLNENTANNAVNDFIKELTKDILNVNPHELTKSKLKSFIAKAKNYIENFTSLGLSETHPEIHEKLEAKYKDACTSLEEGTYLYPYSDEDYILGCNLVMREQGANKSSDESQRLVMCVALNRKKYGSLYAKNAKDPNNPTLLEVITQPGQYGKGYSYDMTLKGITEKVKENVRKVFEHEFECPDNVLFQTGIYYSNKKLYKKCWNPAPFNNYTYFYYGRTS